MAQVGLAAPAFTLPSTKNATSAHDLGTPVSLADYAGRWLVLFFYPLDFSTVCPTEIRALSDRYREFTDLGADVLGASTNSVQSHFEWLSTPVEKNGIAGVRYPLLSDDHKDVSRAYGVLDEAKGYAQRGLFIIDPAGIVRYSVVSSDHIGRSVDETLRVLQALQSGGTCAADWKPVKKPLPVA